MAARKNEKLTLKNEKKKKIKHIMSAKEPDILCLQIFNISDLWLRNSLGLLKNSLTNSSFFIIIIIIILCNQHGYSWPSLVPPAPYRLSPPAGSQDYSPYPHRAAVRRFELVALLLRGHVNGVHRSTSLMCSSLLLKQCPACFVRLT